MSKDKNCSNMSTAYMKSAKVTATKPLPVKKSSKGKKK